MPTHFRGGVSNALYGENLFQFGMLDPTKYHVYFNDFDEYVVGDWTLTTVEAGGSSASEALTDTDGGCLLITNDTNEDDSDFFQKIGESFKWASTKDMFFKARFKISDATQSDFVMGLQITDTAPMDVTDGLFFTKADASTSISFRVEKDNTATSTTVGTCTTSFMVLGFHYKASDGLFHIFMDDVEIGTSVSTNAPDDEELTVSFGIQNGEAVAKTMTLDYIFVALAR